MSVSRLRSDNSGCDDKRSLANDRVDQIPSIVVAYGAMRARLVCAIDDSSGIPIVAPARPDVVR